MKKLIGLFSLIAFSFSSLAQNKYAIIPKPTQLLTTTGDFLVNAQTKILIPNDF